MKSSFIQAISRVICLLLLILWSPKVCAENQSKEEPAGLSQEENIKVGRGMAFQAFAAEQAQDWRAARDLYTAAMEKAPEILWIRLRRGS